MARMVTNGSTSKRFNNKAQRRKRSERTLGRRRIDRVYLEEVAQAKTARQARPFSKSSWNPFRVRVTRGVDQPRVAQLRR